MTRATEEVCSDAFLVRFDSANDGLKNSLYHFVESILTEMAQKGALDEVFDRSIECWTQSSSFMDTFARRALMSSRIVLPVAKFIRKNMRDQEEERKAEINITDMPFQALESPSDSSRLSRSS